MTPRPRADQPAWPAPEAGYTRLGARLASRPAS